LHLIFLFFIKKNRAKHVFLVAFRKITWCMRMNLLKTQIAILAAAAPSFLMAKMPAPLMDNDPYKEVQEIMPQVLSKYGKVISSAPVGMGELTAWVIEKNGKRGTFYTTRDGNVMIYGALWDTVTGKNISDQFIVTTSKTSAMAPADGWLVGPTPSGKVPPAIVAVDELAGVREGKPAVAMDTLYIIYDPRCPHCQEAYRMLRPYVAKGASIKWIPTVALGDDPVARGMNAALLQAKPTEVAALMQKILGGHAQITVTPNLASNEAMNRNLDFLFKAFSASGQKSVGVPAAFFFNKKTKQPHLLTGIDDVAVLRQIFGY
jgi:thiol:disulfide interchange protein DsbG